MRKIMTLVLTGAIAIGLVGAVSVASADEAIQTEEFTLKPTKLSKKKFANVRYVNTIVTKDAPGEQQPLPAGRTVLDYSKAFKFNYNKVPTCKVDSSTLASQPTPAAAKSACGADSAVSEDSGSSAQVRVDLGATATVINVDVVAFNAKNASLYLYSKPNGTAQGIAATVLTGKLKDSKVNGFGKALDVTIPKLGAGAISFFEVTIPKSKYVQARCKPKTIKIQATTYFENGSKTTDDDSVKCKVKK